MKNEHEIQTEIIEFLNKVGIFCWRNNVGRKKNMYFGKKGSCDISGILRNGKRLEIEVKREDGGKLSKDQIEFIEIINYNKGVAFVARSVEDVAKKLKL